MTSVAATRTTSSEDSTTASASPGGGESPLDRRVQTTNAFPGPLVESAFTAVSASDAKTVKQKRG